MNRCHALPARCLLMCMPFANKKSFTLCMFHFILWYWYWIRCWIHWLSQTQKYLIKRGRKTGLGRAIFILATLSTIHIAAARLIRPSTRSFNWHKERYCVDLLPVATRWPRHIPAWSEGVRRGAMTNWSRFHFQQRLHWRHVPSRPKLAYHTVGGCKLKY